MLASDEEAFSCCEDDAYEEKKDEQIENQTEGSEEVEAPKKKVNPADLGVLIE